MKDDLSDLEQNPSAAVTAKKKTKKNNQQTTDAQVQQPKTVDEDADTDKILKEMM